MTFKALIVLSASLMIYSGAYAADAAPPSRDLTIDQNGQVTMTSPAQPNMMVLPPPVDPNNREIDGKTATGDEQKTIIDQGGNLKMVSPPKPDAAPAPMAAPDSTMMQDMPAVKK